MPRLILARHGQSEWNVQRRVQGGGSLTELGRAQAAALAQRLRPEPVAALYASPTLRTRQTARILAAAHGLPVRQRKTLLDLDYGDYAGALVVDVQQSAPELFKRRREAPETVQFPNGENLGNLRLRMQRFLAEVTARHKDETVLVATHDSPIRTIVALVLGLDDSRHCQFVAEVGSMTVVEVSEVGGRLVVLNSTFHLEEVNGHLEGADGYRS